MTSPVLIGWACDRDAAAALSVLSPPACEPPTRRNRPRRPSGLLGADTAMMGGVEPGWAMAFRTSGSRWDGYLRDRHGTMTRRRPCRLQRRSPF